MASTATPQCLKVSFGKSPAWGSQKSARTKTDSEGTLNHMHNVRPFNGLLEIVLLKG